MDKCNWISVPNEKKGNSMRDASRKESVVVWKVEVGKGRIRKRSPRGLTREIRRNPDRFPLEFVFQITIKETLTLRSSGSRSQTVTVNWSWQSKLDSFDHTV